MALPSGKIRLTSQCEMEWLQGRKAEAVCPNCGHAGITPQLLEMDYDLLGVAGHYRLLCCPHCAVRFTDAQGTVDYAGDELIEIGWPAYYAQIGAGIWPISDPLTRITKPAGARALEIGGAYGFGLDFCVHAKGWRGVGYDPSPLAGIGARELGLDIRQGYFTEETLGDGPWDVIISTEVIEHLNEPPGFLRLMRRAVADDGILLLTTPNADWITPALPPGELYALLAPGAHVVLQSPQSLKMALEAAGFAHVVVRAEAASLVAYASPSPFTLEEDETARRAVYRRYLQARAGAAAAGSDLRIGFAGRGLFDAVNDQDMEGAQEAWAVLDAACAARFGFRLEGLEALPAGAAQTSLEGLAEKMPLGLGMMLFSRCMQRLAAGDDRQAVRPLLALALEAIAALQAALDHRSLGRDRLCVSIAEVARVELLLCDAEAGRPEAAAALLALGDKIAGWRGFVALVNARAYEAAARLRAGLLGDWPEAEIPAGLRRDALLSLANAHLAPGQDAFAALRAADELQALGEPVDAIRLGVFVRLVNGGRYEEALELLARYDLPALAARVGGEAARDTGLARMVLDLAVGDPAEIPARLQGVELEPARRDALLLEAFIRLVNASRYEEALAYIQAHDVTALAARVGGEVARDTGLARVVLDLAVGDPAEIPARLRGLELEPARRDALLLEAFIRLVNASRYEEALAYIQAHDVTALAARVGGEVARDTGLARVVLDLAVGDPAEIPARLQGLELEPKRRDALLLEAFIRLVNASRYEEALAYIQAHDVTALAVRVGGEVARDTGLARVVLDLAVGDPAEIPARLQGLELEPKRRDALLLEAFIRLVNASRYEEALAYIQAHDVTALAARVGGEVARDTGLARVVLDLAVGDPAEIPARLRGLELEPKRRDALLLEAFIRLVNASRYEEAQAFFAAHDVPVLAARVGGEVARDTGLARVVLDLAVGDPAEIPAWLDGLDLEPAQREALLLEAFIRLVNASRYEEALAYIRAHDVEALAARALGKNAQDARLALVVLDLSAGDPAEVPVRLEGLDLTAERHAALLLEAFIRLVNEARYQDAKAILETHQVSALLGQVAPAIAADAAIGLAVLELGIGDPVRVPEHLSRVELAPEKVAGLMRAAFTGLVNEGRYEEADAFAAAQTIEAGLEAEAGDGAASARLAAILLDLQQGRALKAARLVLGWERLDGQDKLGPYYVEAFQRLMNAGELEAARSLEAKGLLSARIALCAQAPRLAALAALVRLDAGPGGDAGCVTQRLDALAEAGADEELLWETGLEAFAQLVNRAQFGAAGTLARRVEPGLARRQSPFSPLERDALFASGMLHLQDERALLRAALALARLRDDLVKAWPPPGEPHPLFWPALRGEIVALIPLRRGEEAINLLKHFTASYSGAPEDLLQHLKVTSA